MPSHDFILDLMEKLDSQGFQYSLNIYDENNKNQEIKVTTYRKFSNEDTLAAHFNVVLEEADEILEAVEEQDKKTQKKKKRKKKDGDGPK